MQMLREISQGIAQSQPLLVGRQYVLALRRMVYLCVVCLRLRQTVRNTGPYVVYKFLMCHI